MKDWVVPLSPVAAVGYFLLFPEHFYALVTWGNQFVR
jgi:hypothetical protein